MLCFLGRAQWYSQSVKLVMRGPGRYHEEGRCCHYQSRLFYPSSLECCAIDPHDVPSHLSLSLRSSFIPLVPGVHNVTLHHLTFRHRRYTFQICFFFAPLFARQQWATPHFCFASLPFLNPSMTRSFSALLCAFQTFISFLHAS